MTTNPTTVSDSVFPTRGPLVLLAEQPNERIDVSKAKSFGEVRVLFNDGDPSCFSSDAYVARLKERLHALDFNPNTDYFCLAGPVANTSFVLAALLREHKVVRVLLYSPGANGYLSRTIDFRNLPT